MHQDGERQRTVGADGSCIGRTCVISSPIDFSSSSIREPISSSEARNRAIKDIQNTPLSRSEGTIWVVARTARLRRPTARAAMECVWQEPTRWHELVGVVQEWRCGYFAR